MPTEPQPDQAVAVEQAVLSWMKEWFPEWDGDQREALAASLADSLRAHLAQPADAELVAALEWYAAQVEDCRKFASAGDSARNALHLDGGQRARAALARRAKS